jgi:hypothetical protein
MSYNLRGNMPEFRPGEVPADYIWRSQQLLQSTGWKSGQLISYCTRINHPLPHVLERRGLQTTRYFNPRQVSEWMKAEAERRAALGQ